MHSNQFDARYYATLECEFDLSAEMKRLRELNHHDLADTLLHLLLALTTQPPRLADAADWASKVANKGYGIDRGLEHLRNAVIRALSPLLYDLPETMTGMEVALTRPESPEANALAAARVIREFGNEFEPH